MTTPETEPAIGDELDETASEPVDDDEPSEEPEPIEPSDEELDEEETAQEQSSHAMIRALEREHTRHEKAVAKVLGVEPAEMHLCPTCEGVGFTPEPLEPEPELRQDPFLERCERCAGYGEVKTGARPPALVTVPCPGCSGQGYVQKAEQPGAGAGFGNGAQVVTGAPPPPQVAPGDLDAVADLRRRGYTIVEPIVVEPASVT